jgi:hypothetical protein
LSANQDVCVLDVRIASKAIEVPHRREWPYLKSRGSDIYLTVMVIFFEMTDGLNGECLASPSTN